MKIKIGDMAKLLNVSSEMVRKYERIGLFAPARLAGGGDRFFYKEDIRKALLLKMYRRMGMSLPDVKKMFTNTNYKISEETLDDRIKMNAQAIREARRQIKMAESMINQLETVQNLLGQQEICDSPDFLVLDENLYFRSETADVFLALADCMPISNFSHIIENSQLQSDRDMIRGLCIAREDALSLNIDASHPAFYSVESMPSIHTVIRIQRKAPEQGMSPPERELHEAFAVQNGYTISGKIIGRSILSWFCGQEDDGYVETWMFLKKDN